MALYKVKVQDADGEEIGEFQSIRRLEFGKRLNNYGTCEIEVPVNDAKAASLIALRRFTVWIYRKEGNEYNLVWSGEQALRKGTLDNKGDNWITLYCFDWFEQLNQRNTAAVESFTEVDAGQIAVSLIDGAFGITTGEIEPTIDRDRTYYNQNVMEGIINLSNVLSGFDFEITNLKVFNVKTTIGVDRTDSMVLNYGYNVDSAVIDEDYTKITNRAIIIGEAEGQDDLVRYVEDDLALQALYGVREMISLEPDVSELTTFENKALSVLRKYGEPLVKIDITISRGSGISILDFTLGDLVRVIINNGIYSIDSDYRIFEWKVAYNSDNTEDLSIVLGNFILGDLGDGVS